MKKILVLTTHDLINPEAVDQHFSKWELKNANIQIIEQSYDIIIMNGEYIKNRFGNIQDKPDINTLLE
ncbi:hypothetical protein [Rodentibacter caecimuris]|uniref:hypothetical protein n=1 Tax=Rodentibacter caecimuris TaxID=1796644 RepID=UPI00258FF1BB|nr:hypothetical protein [Rodentibacter heylii]